VFQQTDADHYQLLAKVPLTLGARTAGYFGKGHKGFDRFFLGVPPRADHGAEIWIYNRSGLKFSIETKGLRQHSLRLRLESVTSLLRRALRGLLSVPIFWVPGDSQESWHRFGLVQ